MEHIELDLNSLVVDICYECFSREATQDWFWVNKYEQWGNSLEKAGAILKAELELELKETDVVVGDYPQYWQKICFVLIHGYGVTIPCYEPYKHGKELECIGYLSLDGIINTAMQWEKTYPLEFQFLIEGYHDYRDCLTKFIQDTIKSTKN